MRIFMSAGEPSGDLHGSNLVHALRRLRPGVECVGFGGERMEAAGCRLLYPLCQLAVMWFLRVLLNAHTFVGLLLQADRYFRRERPDAVILVDFPGFNWWIARRARAHGIPVFYFVPPQLWGWAGWRVRKMQRWVDHVLCTLPFEEEWYRVRGVKSHYIGHPYFDELSRQQFDEEFVAQQQSLPGRIIGLLPGSRAQEIDRNLSTLVRAATLIHEVRADARFLVACFLETHRRQIDDYLRMRNVPFIRTCLGQTAEIIRVAHSCIAVSGSVGLELLYQTKPSVVLYRIRPIDLRVCRFFKTSRFISLVNLLADKELFPEFLTDRCEAQGISEYVLRWLDDRGAYGQACGELALLKARVADPGACERAACFVLATLDGRSHHKESIAA